METALEFAADDQAEWDDIQLVQQAVTDAYERVQCLINDRAPRQLALDCLVNTAEKIQGFGAVSSILLLDDQGLLRNGASPQLPQDYLSAIDRLKPNANIGTCAAAAATGKVVVTPSFLADDKWAELRHLPLALGFVGAWSTPIISSADGRVLGTFGTYYRSNRTPNLHEVAAVNALAATAACALEAIQ